MPLRPPPPDPQPRELRARNYLTGSMLAVRIAEELRERSMSQASLADALLDAGLESGSRAGLRSRIARALNPEDDSLAADNLRASMLRVLRGLDAVGPFYQLTPPGASADG